MGSPHPNPLPAAGGEGVQAVRRHAAAARARRCLGPHAPRSRIPDVTAGLFGLSKFAVALAAHVSSDAASPGLPLARPSLTLSLPGRGSHRRGVKRHRQ
jgi:hypothetical protein